MAAPLPDYAFKFQKIWLTAVLKDGLLIPICFKKDTAYKCSCVDQTYGRPDPSCKQCYGTGYTSLQEIENRKWVLALSAPLDQETIQKFGLGNYLKSTRMLLISYPVSPEFTRLYDIQPKQKVFNAEGDEIDAELGWIVQPQDQEAKISFSEKLWNGALWEIIERKFHVVAVESYKVSEFAIGQKVIIRETTSTPSSDRFLPKDDA